MLKYWPILVMQLTKSNFFWPHVVFNFYNGVTPPSPVWRLGTSLDELWNVTTMKLRKEMIFVSGHLQIIGKRVEMVGLVELRSLLE